MTTSPTFLVCQLLSQRRQLGTQLRRQDETAVLPVCHPQGLQDLLLRRLLLELLMHDAQEGGEVQPSR